MNFAEAVKETTKWTRTENGAVALNTTGHACLDLFGCIGSLREADENRITTLFEEAYKEAPLLATKIVFYSRDIRGGQGERRTFRILIQYMALYHPEALRPNIHLIPEYGRYDDVFHLLHTPLEEDMFAFVKKQLEADLKAMNEGRAVSLLAKWLPTADASSKNTRKMGIFFAQKLGYPVYNFKRMARALRKHIGIVEAKMSAGEWGEINYSSVPGRAMLNYRNAFKKHDEERYGNYIAAAVQGKEKIHSSTLYPYDLVEKILDYSRWNLRIEQDPTVEAQWKQLPNYVEEGTNAIVIADTSGSMMGRPMASALGLAIYFAERNKGAYHNLWMTFSNNPTFQRVKGETLAQKLSSMDMSGWSMNTDLQAAFQLVLNTAIRNNVPPDEMPKSLIVISDMEIDYCGNRNWTFYDKMRSMFEERGYQIPNIVFWNVNSRHDIFHADSKRTGVQLVSGQSAATFKNLIGAIGMTPVEYMIKTIICPRYEAITVGDPY